MKRFFVLLISLLCMVMLISSCGKDEVTEDNLKDKISLEPFDDNDADNTDVSGESDAPDITTDKDSDKVDLSTSESDTILDFESETEELSTEQENYELTDDETLADIMDEGLIVRNQAYANYIQALVSNAKANGASTKVDDVLKAEVLRIYNAYYESQISVIFQNFYVQDYLLDLDGTGDKATLNDKAVVAKFLEEVDKYCMGWCE